QGWGAHQRGESCHNRWSSDQGTVQSMRPTAILLNALRHLLQRLQLMVRGATSRLRLQSAWAERAFPLVQLVSRIGLLLCTTIGILYALRWQAGPPSTSLQAVWRFAALALIPLWTILTTASLFFVPASPRRGLSPADLFTVVLLYIASTLAFAEV